MILGTDFHLCKTVHMKTAKMQYMKTTWNSLQIVQFFTTRERGGDNKGKHKWKRKKDE